MLVALVNQIIAAYAPVGGTVIVVLTQRDKLEMEELFRWVGWGGGGRGAQGGLAVMGAGAQGVGVVSGWLSK